MSASVETNKPIVFLAFANDRLGAPGHLHKLHVEARCLREILNQAEQNGLCQLIERQNATIDDILRVFQSPENRNRIAIFHFAGHANEYQLLLQSACGQPAIADAGGLALFLAQQQGLELVFLNGCSTEQQTQGLLDAGVSCVISTSQAIKDTVATEFATRFYQALASGVSIQTAFGEAEASARLAAGGKTRGAYIDGPNGNESNIFATYWPWQLSNRKGSEIAAEWNLPSAVQNPLFGLPPLPPIDPPPQPFRYLHRYKRNDAPVFFGRDHEIRALYDLVGKNKAPIVLLYGQSGIGKSSILAAGLMPRLEESHLVQYVRRDRQFGLRGTLERVLNELNPHSLPDNDGRNLNCIWHEIEAAHDHKPLIVIVDQVEEVYADPFSSSGGDDELAEVIAAAKCIFDNPNKRPLGKLILSFRQEWLNEIESQLKEGHLYFDGYYLRRLNRSGIINAVNGATNGNLPYQMGVESHLADLIADDLLEDAASPVSPTLQILLTEMWQRARPGESHRRFFSRELYQQELRRDGNYLRGFLDQQLASLQNMKMLQSEEANLVESGLALDMLYFFTSDVGIGTSAQRTKAELLEQYAHVQYMAEWFTLVCRDRLSLLVSIDQFSTGNSAVGQPEAKLSLIHDALAPEIRRQFDRSSRPGKQARRILENRSLEWSDGKEGTPLDESDLTLVEQNQHNMRAWTEAERRLIRASQTARMKRQEAEREAEAQRKKAARQLRHTLYGLVAATAVSLLIVSAAWIRDQTLANRRNVIQSEGLASQALSDLNQDPVRAINTALEALPDPLSPRPYVPAAEFALTRALHNNLEETYLAAAPSFSGAEQVDFGNNLIAVGGDHVQLIPLDLNPNQIIMLKREMTGTVSAVAWSDDELLLLSREKQSIHVWEGKELVYSKRFTETVTCAEWQPQSYQIAICEGQQLHLWSHDTMDSKQVHRFQRTLTGALWSPDGRRLAAWDKEAANSWQTLAIWHEQTDQLTMHPITHTARIRDLAWSHDSQFVAIALHDATLSVWSIDDLDRPFTTLNAGLKAGSIHEVEFVDNEKLITWGSKDIVRLWSVSGSKPLPFGYSGMQAQDVYVRSERRGFMVSWGGGLANYFGLNEDEEATLFLGHSGRILATEWRNGYIATASFDGTARIWEQKTGNLYMTLHGHSTPAQNAEVFSVKWLNDMQVMTVGTDGSLRIWRVFDDSGMPMCSEYNDIDGPLCYNFSQRFEYKDEIQFALWVDNNTVVTTDRRFIARKLNLESGETQLLQADSDLIWNLDGTHVFTFSNETGSSGQVLQFPDKSPITTIPGPFRKAYWLEAGLLLQPKHDDPFFADPYTGEIYFSLSGITRTITNIALHQSGRLAVADESGLIHVWDTENGQNLGKLQDTTISADWQNLEVLWHSDGKRLLSTGPHITLWDTDTSEIIWTIDDPELKSADWNTVGHVAFSPAEELVSYVIGNHLLIVDIETGEVLDTRLSIHADPILGVQWVEGGAWNGQATSWPFLTPLIRWLGGESWRADNSRLMTWSGDGTARLWDWESEPARLTEVMRMGDEGPINVAAINTDGTRILTAGYSGTLSVWDAWINQPDQLRTIANSRKLRFLITQ